MDLDHSECAAMADATRSPVELWVRLAEMACGPAGAVEASRPFP
jgi:hypothetical protein